MPEGLQQGETLEPLSGFPPPSMPDDVGASHPSLREGETLEPIGQPTYPDTGDSSPIGRDTGFVHGLIRGGRNIVHAAKEFGSDIANPDMPVALSDRPEDQGSVAARLQGDTMLNKYVLRPAAQEKQRSLDEADAMHRTSGLESFGHGLTSMIHTAGEFVPVAGPLIGSLVDRGREGDVSGAVAKARLTRWRRRSRADWAGKQLPRRATFPGSVKWCLRSKARELQSGRAGSETCWEGRNNPVHRLLPGVAPAEGEYPAALPHGQYEAPASPLPSPHQLGSGTTEPAPSAAPGDYAAAEPATARTPAEYPPVTWIPRAPVTENPVVGSLVRAMQKSGLPIAERPNLLLKGSGRVNRILGAEEDLAGPLAKSLRQARRQKSANAGPLSRLR
jgi:hypothetical protein